MPMIDIDAIARQYEALGLTPPAGLTYAVQRFRDAQEYVNESLDDPIIEGLLDQTHTRDTLRTAMREVTLDDLLQQNYGRRMQGIDATCTKASRVAIGEDYPGVVKQLADRFADEAATITDALEHFAPEDFLNPTKILEREEAALRYHTVQRAIRNLDQVRGLIVAIDSNAINDPAFFVDLDDTAV